MSRTKPDIDRLIRARENAEKLLTDRNRTIAEQRQAMNGYENMAARSNSMLLIALRKLHPNEDGAAMDFTPQDFSDAQNWCGEVHPRDGGGYTFTVRRAENGDKVEKAE